MRRKVIAYRVEAESACKTVVLNRWRALCASCFDVEVEKAGVAYRFTDMQGQSWSGRCRAYDASGGEAVPRVDGGLFSDPSCR
jgi:hypothetical protein